MSFLYPIKRDGLGKHVVELFFWAEIIREIRIIVSLFLCKKINKKPILNI